MCLLSLGSTWWPGNKRGNTPAQYIVPRHLNVLGMPDNMHYTDAPSLSLWVPEVHTFWKTVFVLQELAWDREESVP